MKKYGLFVDAIGTLVNDEHILKKTLYNDAKIFLNEIKSRRLENITLITGIITNCGNEIHNILKSFKIQECFDHIICSDDAHALKPSKIIFHYAANEAQLKPQHMFFIGDSLHNDALGAKIAGMTGIWLNRGNANLGDFSPQCSSLMDSLKIIKKIINNN